MTGDRATSGLEDQLLQKLMMIYNDPAVRRLARARAEDPCVAEAALLEAFVAIAEMEHPERIADLGRYFRAMVISVIHRARSAERERSQREEGPRGKHGPAALQVPPGGDHRGWLERFSAGRDRLTAAVPGRSPDPGRYRNLIAAVAERVLGAVPDQGGSGPDPGRALQAGYPEWFQEAGCTAAGRDARLARARSDLRNLLLAVVQSEVDSRAAAGPGAGTAYGDARARVQAMQRDGLLSAAEVAFLGPALSQARDEQVEAIDDGLISALFRGADLVLLAHEAPYDLGRELDLFTGWLDREE
jgi:hypothetical protein